MLATHTITMRPIKEGARAAEGKANQWWVSLSGQSIVRPKKVNGNHENIRIVVELSSKEVESNSGKGKSMPGHQNQAEVSLSSVQKDNCQSSEYQKKYLQSNTFQKR